jgi:hypothetical protein
MVEVEAWSAPRSWDEGGRDDQAEGVRVKPRHTRDTSGLQVLCRPAGTAPAAYCAREPIMGATDQRCTRIRAGDGSANTRSSSPRNTPVPHRIPTLTQHTSLITSMGSRGERNSIRILNRYLRLDSGRPVWLTRQGRRHLPDPSGVLSAAGRGSGRPETWQIGLIPGRRTKHGTRATVRHAWREALGALASLHGQKLRSAAVADFDDHANGGGVGGVVEAGGHATYADFAGAFVERDG